MYIYIQYIHIHDLVVLFNIFYIPLKALFVAVFTILYVHDT